jgi:hypothetical protein
MVPDTTTAENLAAAINLLPSMAGASVSAAEARDSGSITYTVTFPASLGNVAELTAGPTNVASGCTATVSTTTQGQSKLESFRLSWGGGVTDPISKTATPAQVSVFCIYFLIFF